MLDDDVTDNHREPTDRVALRFLAPPGDVRAAGSAVPAGRVMEWINRAA